MASPNKRSLMIKGSQWTAQQDFDVQIKYNVYTPKSATEYYGGKYSLGVMTTLKIKKGAVLTITGKKFFTDLIYQADAKAEFVNDIAVSKDSADIVYVKPINQSGGQNFEPVIDGENIRAIIQYNSIAPYVEQDGEADQQTFWVLRDTATGKFYRTTNWDYARGKSTEAYDMEDKLTKAKKHTDLGKVKTTILNFTGYYNGLDDFSGNSPDWVGNNSGYGNGHSSYPLVPTLEAVKFEKFTNKELEVVDIQSWYANTLRLRVLTQKYGQSVRAVYKKLEDAKTLSTNQYIVNFRTTLGRASKGDHAELTTGDIGHLEAALKQFGIKKPIKAKGVFDYSVAAGTVADAVALKLLDTKLNVTVIDLNTMQEEVVA